MNAQLVELMAPERIIVRAAAGSKKSALEAVSALIAGSHPGLTETKIYDCLLARERLGSTGIGHGIAIPHGRLPSIVRPVGAFAALEKGVDFAALDGAPVDLILALVVPAESTEQHLRILTSLATLFSDERLREGLRQAASPEAAYTLLTGDDAAPRRRAAAPA